MRILYKHNGKFVPLNALPCEFDQKCSPEETAKEIIEIFEKNRLYNDH